MKDKPTTAQKLKLPTKSDGNEYIIQEANEKQQHIMFLVIETLKEWVTWTTNPSKIKHTTFKPLRLTVRGMAGSGKSYLLHLLSTVIRKKFGINGVDIKVAPTGTAAFNINGQTCHSAFAIGISNKKTQLSQAKQHELIQKYRHLVALLVDERSLLSSATLGGMEANASKVVHGGSHSNEDWGGIPVVIIMGDDRQIPPVRTGLTGRGAFQILQCPSNQFISDIEQNGEAKFRDLAKTVVTLSKNQRVSSQNSEFRKILERLRIDEQTEKDARIITNLNLTNHENKRLQLQNSPDTLHLFAYNKAKQDFNLQRLSSISSENNPVAIMKSKVTGSSFSVKKKQFYPRFNHFKDNSCPRVCTICIGCKVALKGRNFNPQWGLFNSTIGTVQEIVYEAGKNPNAGDLPLYVAVSFPTYCGPKWDTKEPTIVPIPVVSCPCDKGCCEMHYVPLEVAFAKTIHTFQGMEAGPTKPIKTLIVHLGDIKFENNNPGLMYTAISRATTIDEENNGENSAIYFLDLSSNHYMQSAIKKRDNKMTQSMKARDKWIEHLDKHESQRKFTTTEKKKLLEWAEKPISIKILNTCIDSTFWRQKM